MKHVSQQVTNAQSLKSKRAILLILAIAMCGLTFSSCQSNSGYKGDDEVVKDAKASVSWRAKALNGNHMGTIVVKKMPFGYKEGDTVAYYGKYVLLNKVTTDTTR